MSKENKGTDKTAQKVDFSTFLYSLGTAALISTGVIPDPITGQTKVNLQEAKQNIDIIEMIEVKTKGNLTEEEAKILPSILHEVRSKYVAACKKEAIQV